MNGNRDLTEQDRGARSWEDAFHELQAQFVRNSRCRLRIVDTRLQALSQNPSERKALLEVMREFHALAGSGGTYGFQNVSNLGRMGESECDAHLNEAIIPGPEELARWRGFLDGIRQEFESAGFDMSLQPFEADLSQLPRVLYLANDPEMADSLCERLEGTALVTYAPTLDDAREELTSGAHHLAVVAVELLPVLGRTFPSKMRVIAYSSNDVTEEVLDRVTAVLCKSVTFEDDLTRLIQSILPRVRSSAN
ncbi:MAG: Hpt domain-containing protein [Acidobacteriota bacterium]|jgi:HPt (histidine-containing phosphotransfer) domain-containing protein